MEVLLLAVMAAANILCFLVGVRAGQKVAKGEPVELPKVNPMEAVRDHRAKKEAEMEQERFNAILRNIDNYDGTAAGQEEVR